jgi:hypothetical protein
MSSQTDEFIMGFAITKWLHIIRSFCLVLSFNRTLIDQSWQQHAVIIEEHHSTQKIQTSKSPSKIVWHLVESSDQDA